MHRQLNIVWEADTKECRSIVRDEFQEEWTGTL